MSSMANMNETQLQELIQLGYIRCRPRRLPHPFSTFYGQSPFDYAFPLMLMQLSAFILLTRLIRFILKPIREPRVVAYILSGLLVGPSVLSANETFRAFVFPESGSYFIANMAPLGFSYFLFVAGVKMDISLVKKVGRKHWIVLLAGVLLPLVASIAMALIVRNDLDEGNSKLYAIWGITSSLAITSFPVLYPILKEFNLLNSEIGRMALQMSVVSDVVGMGGVLLFEGAKQESTKAMSALWFLLSFFGVMIFIFGVLRPFFHWIIRTTPEGQQVDQIYIVMIMLGVMVSGFVADFLGLAICNGPIWLGLAVPDGPPLGSTLVEKTETFVNEFLMPFAFIYIGMLTDVHTLGGYWHFLQPLLWVVLVTYSLKLIATLIASRYVGLSNRDSVSLSLAMSLRGELEFLLFLHWWDLKIISQPHFALLMCTTVSVTALASPVISFLYDPTRPYMVNKRRTIQHKIPNAELHCVVCIDGEESLSGLLKLLKVSNPSATNPFSVYALRLVELVARANPIFIDHETEDNVYDPSNFYSFRNALNIFQETIGDYMRIQSYTTVSPKSTMHQDICELALSKKASFIILPLNKQSLCTLEIEPGAKQQYQSVNSNVLARAPCSVGVLLDKSANAHLTGGVLRSSYHEVVVLFLGGADAREALTYADLMAQSPEVTLTVIRFLASESEGDDEMEKRLDDRLVTWFWVKNEANDRIIYREVIVNSGEETIAAIRSMEDNYDLWIVGRKHGINPYLLQGLTSWSDNNELGVIGDYVATMDFVRSASILAVQQQSL